MPPGLAGYVMVPEREEGQIKREDFRDSENNGEEDEQELLERSFVSREGGMARGRAGGRGGPDAELGPFPRTGLSEPPAASAASQCGAWKLSLARMLKCGVP